MLERKHLYHLVQGFLLQNYGEEDKNKSVVATTGFTVFYASYTGG